MRIAGTTDTLDPQYFEPISKVLWEIDFTLVVFGVIGIVSLLWRPRYLWRGGLLLSVGAFIFASGLSLVSENLQECGCSAAGVWRVISSYATTFNTFITHIIGPPILLSCICYAVFAKLPESINNGPFKRRQYYTADPDLRPNSVFCGVIALLISTTISGLSAFIQGDDGANVPLIAFLLIVVAVFAVFSTSLYLTWRGKNWARWVVLIWCVLGWISLAWPPSYILTQSPTGATLTIASTIIEMFGCWQLFVPNSAMWFRPLEHQQISS